jgi:hypothetical protein
VTSTGFEDDATVCFTRFEVLTAVLMEIPGFCERTTCIWYIVIGVSEELASSIFRAVSDYPGHGASKLLRNASNYNSMYGVKSHKTAVSISLIRTVNK